MKNKLETKDGNCSSELTLVTMYIHYIVIGLF